MEYICETKAYTVVEFHNRFKDSLPQLVTVVQGYHGDRPEDDFHRDQVLCIQAVSRQQRVISKFKASTHQEHLFSIPSTYLEKLSIVRQHGGKDEAGKEKLLSEILCTARPPLTVCFPRGRTITNDGVSISTDNTPNIKLLQTVDEIHLIANCITDGKMFTGVVHIPLYLTQLRLSFVTGIKTYSTSQWKGFQKRLDRASSDVEYDRQYSNSDILEYDSSAIHTDLATYTYVAPRRYTNMVSLVQRLVVHGPREQQNVGGNGAQRNPDSSRTVHNEKVIKQSFDEYEDIGNATRVILASDSREPQIKFESGSPIVSPRTTSPPFIQSNVSNDKRTQPMRMALPLPESNAPALPKRIVNRSTPKTHGDVPHHYANDVPRTVIQPTVHNKQITPHGPENSGQTISDRVEYPGVPKVSHRHEVSKLTIEEVIAHLNKLGLGQYEEIFRDQKIDGALLVELDKDMLKYDLGMKSIEALKITKFIKDGHVPV